MKTFLVIILFCALILGYVVLNKNNGGDVLTESDLNKIEEQKASEPTVEESLDAQFGISEEEAEARYAQDMPKN